MKNAIYNIEGGIGREVSISNKKYIFCSGTSYLGFWSNKSYHKKIAKGLALFGSNFPMSRISNLRLSIFDEFESYLSNIYEEFEAITFSSGYLTGQAIMETFANIENCFFSQNLHPALKKEITKSCLLVENWEKGTVEKINKSEGESYCIFANSVDSLYGKIHNFEWLNSLNEKNKIILILDDSHGFGIIGKNNRGIIDYLPNLPNVDYIIMSSLGKAYGIPGGVIICSSRVKKIFEKSPFYTASSPIIPAYLYAYLNSLSDRKKMLDRLQNNINNFENGIKNIELFKSSPTFPVFHTTQNKLFGHCLTSNIFISSFSYPKEEDEKITRIVINALHTKNDIKHLIKVCKTFNQNKKDA